MTHQPIESNTPMKCSLRSPGSVLDPFEMCGASKIIGHSHHLGFSIKNIWKKDKNQLGPVQPPFWVPWSACHRGQATRRTVLCSGPTSRPSRRGDWDIPVFFYGAKDLMGKCLFVLQAMISTYSIETHQTLCQEWDNKKHVHILWIVYQ